MGDDTEWKDLTADMKTYGTMGASSLMEGVFFAIWILIQCGVSEFAEYFELYDPVDKVVLWAFRILFSIPTLAPVIERTCTHIVGIITRITDVVVSVVEARQRIRLAMKLSKGNDANDQ